MKTYYRIDTKLEDGRTIKGERFYIESSAKIVKEQLTQRNPQLLFIIVPVQKII